VYKARVLSPATLATNCPATQHHIQKTVMFIYASINTQMTNRFWYTSDINVQDYNTMGHCIPEAKRVYAMICNLEYKLITVTVMKNEIDSHSFLHP
jgi:hypothetical protein